jgi:hypothetical protein
MLDSFLHTACLKNTHMQYIRGHFTEQIRCLITMWVPHTLLTTAEGEENTHPTWPALNEEQGPTSRKGSEGGYTFLEIPL